MSSNFFPNLTNCGSSISILIFSLGPDGREAHVPVTGGRAAPTGAPAGPATAREQKVAFRTGKHKCYIILYRIGLK